MSCRGTEQNRREIDYLTQSDRRTLERLFQGFDLEVGDGKTSISHNRNLTLEQNQV